LTDIAPDEKTDVKSSGGPPGPSLVDSVAAWEMLKGDIVEQLDKLTSALEQADNIRRYLQAEYGVAVPDLLPFNRLAATTGVEKLEVAESTPAEQDGPLPPVEEGAGVREWTPPLQRAVQITEPTTGPADVEKIRRDSAMPAAGGESMDSFTQRMLGNIGKTLT
jgi:hypothetical protein